MGAAGANKQHVEVVDKQLERYNALDLHGFCSCYHPDVTVEWILSKKIVSQGLTDFRSRYEQLFASSPKLHCEIKSRLHLADSIVDEEFVTGINGLPEGLHTVAIYGFLDGLINRVWFVR
jgi:hypothetical protein